MAPSTTPNRRAHARSLAANTRRSRVMSSSSRASRAVRHASSAGASQHSRGASPSHSASPTEATGRNAVKASETSPGRRANAQ